MNAFATRVGCHPLMRVAVQRNAPFGKLTTRIVGILSKMSKG